MKTIIFAISLFIFGCNMSIYTNHEINIHSTTDVFINKNTRTAIDKEVFSRKFAINFASDQLITIIPLTGEKTINTIISKKKTFDQFSNKEAIEFIAFNEKTKQEELYLLFQKPNSEEYELYQEIKDTEIRLFFSKESRCVH
jgi:hypothetical protein